LCLQAEADDDTRANIASGISNKSRDVVNGVVPAVGQVNYFISDDFVTRDILRCF